jgi:hypothetical protein
MPTTPDDPSRLRPHWVEGSWTVSDSRYFGYSVALLEELEGVNEQVDRSWPKPLHETIKDEDIPDSLKSLVQKRDMLSDSIKIYTAMSVEAFLNFYGVLRLGEETFAKVERSGLSNKLRKLLAVCDSINLLNEEEPIVLTIKRIADRRNGMVHPKTQELQAHQDISDFRKGDKIPQVAREAVSDMTFFYQEFTRLVPQAAHHINFLPNESV